MGRAVSAVRPALFARYEQLKQLFVCPEELERVIKLREVFREAVDICMDRDNRPGKIMSERVTL